MSLIEDLVLWGGYAVQILAHLVLLVVCLTRLPRPWALAGAAAGLLGVLTLSLYLVRNLMLRFGDDPLGTADLLYAGWLGLLAQAATVLSVVLLVAAALVGRREKPADHSGPTGTTFRQLPGGVRWE